MTAVMQVLACVCAWDGGMCGGVCEIICALSAAMILITAVMQVLVCLCAWGWGYVKVGCAGVDVGEVCIYLCTSVHCSTAVTLTMTIMQVPVCGEGHGGRCRYWWGVYMCIYIYIYIYVYT